MLSGSAFLRVVIVLVAAVVLTGLVQRYWLFDSDPGEAPSASVASGPVRRPEVRPAPAPTPARAAEAVIKPFPKAAEPPQALAASPQAPAAPPQAPAAPPRPPAAPVAAAPATLFGEPPPPQPAPPPAQAARTPTPPQPTAVQDAAPAETDARAIDLVDLNTGSLAALNGLKGGGAIGRTIVQNRPYTAIDQLLSKRVLSRAIYQRIKDQVTVR